MEQFRTGLSITPKPMIDHRLSIVTAGSCFSDNIGQKLSQNKFNVLVNPLGTCYNPLSIHKGLMMTEPDEDLYVESQGMWRHFDFHSKFAASSKEELRDILRKQLSRPSTDIMMITYGTSWIYKHKATGKIVANCHKRPQHEFDKILLTPKQVADSFDDFRGSMKQKVIVTLSPVRHIKDTLELNAVSKSVLRYAIHQLKDVEYFPAYEIMMDDLRDYRFYDSDMLHPSQVAVDYIWEKFGEKYFSTDTRDIIGRWQKVLRSLNHRVFNENTGQYKDFLKGILKELEALRDRLNVEDEIIEITRRLA
jgi:hypothetical protein